MRTIRDGEYNLAWSILNALDVKVSPDANEAANVAALIARFVDEQTDKSEGAGLILAERIRQIEVEGWTSDHDDKHGRGQLTDAAMCYTLAGDGMSDRGWSVEQARVEMLAFCWPWEAQWCKPAPTAAGNYVKAGALIAAEIDRQKRSKGRAAK